MPHLPVLIIGSGLGGLTLAQGLSKHSIPFRVFERDAAQEQRLQGYRIRIHSDGIDALRTCLSEEVMRRFEETCAVHEKPGGRVDARTGEVMGPLTRGQAANSGAPRPDPGMVSLPADRRVMRSALLTNLEHLVSYGKDFTHYTVSSSSVTAHFADGTTAQGSLLVGADGIQSRVATQLIVGKAEPLDLARMIFGKTTLTQEVESTLLSPLRNGIAMAMDRNDMETRGQLSLFVESMRFTHPGAPPDYVYWVLLGERSFFGTDDRAILSSSCYAAAQMAIRATSDWHPGIRVILEAQEPTQTSALRLTSSDPEGVVNWPTERRVTLLGDSVHCMAPTGGSGANTALRDAALLVSVLSRGSEEAGWDKEVVAEYEAGMREAAGKAVAMSYAAASQAFGIRLPK
jgi:2-polyprenyl-6-methoxyphenol hydroxylase-like FAD-dependent oxidoreductase